MSLFIFSAKVDADMRIRFSSIFCKLSFHSFSAVWPPKELGCYCCCHININVGMWHVRAAVGMTGVGVLLRDNFSVRSDPIEEMHGSFDFCLSHFLPPPFSSTHTITFSASGPFFCSPFYRCSSSEFCLRFCQKLCPPPPQKNLVVAVLQNLKVGNFRVVPLLILGQNL